MMRTAGCWCVDSIYVLTTITTAAAAAAVPLLPSFLLFCQEMSGARFELAVFDEAHVMAGRETKAKKYSFGLDDSRIALERRLFLTATPRTYKQPRAAKAKAKATAKATATKDERGESTVTSMDNVAAFGPVVYQMTHQQAVDKGIVTPLEILVYNVTDGYADMCRRYPKVRGEDEPRLVGSMEPSGTIRTIGTVGTIGTIRTTRRN